MKQAEIARLLPEIFQRTLAPGNPLTALMAVTEGMQSPSEAVLENLDAYFDPYRTPDRFVPFLASWLDLEPLLVSAPDATSEASLVLPSGLGRLRELVASAVSLAKLSGTAKGLTAFLETATGIHGFSIQDKVLNENGEPRPFHLRIDAPPQAREFHVLIEQIIELEKPAYTTYELTFGPIPEPLTKGKAA